MSKTHLLFLTILIEGYVVLASELLAMRQLVPFVGSGTEIIAIVISGVLLPLAIGYHVGGTAYKRIHARLASRISVRKILVKNILTALTILGLGLSYIFMTFFFELITLLGLHNRMLQTTIYVALFLVWPVFLLGQTVPLVSHYFSRRKLSEITGRMLFFSTTGSFFGSVFTTIVLMSVIGVHNTVIVTMGMLALLVPLLVRRLLCFEVIMAAFVMLVVFTMNNSDTISSLGIVSNNAYNTVAVEEIPKENARILNVNRSSSSKVAENPEHQFNYWKYIDSRFIKPISTGSQPPKEILIIGAGGFSIGQYDAHNNYTYVDIDPELQAISEEHFLKEKLGKNKKFVPLSARAFLRQDKKKYDFILLDTFTNTISIPMECTTQEFLQDVKDHLKPGGIVAANIISNPTFDERFTVRYYNTFASVFPQFTTQILTEFNAWYKGDGNYKGLPPMHNVIYVYYDNEFTGDKSIYTDNQNTYSLDR